MPIQASFSVDIAAPMAVVWDVMLDFPAYGQWNPFIVEVMGGVRRVEVGQHLGLRVRWKDGTEVTSGECITCVDAPAQRDGRQTAELAYRFTGALHTLNLVRAIRTQRLTAKDGATTRYETREGFSGLFRSGVPLDKVQDGFERHARALKARAEL